jgi:RND family efflux transporter MFP subunit
MIAAVVVAVAGGGTLVWKSLRSSHRLVQLAEASLESRFASDVVLIATGHVEPAARATVSALAPGRVAKVFVQEGQQVHDGDVIAQLDTALMESEIALAKFSFGASKAKLRVATRALSEARAKQKRAGQAPPELAQANASAEVARAEMRAAAAKLQRNKLALTQFKVLATLSGRIWKLHADVGQNLNDASLVVADIVDTSTLFVDADVAEAKLGDIKPTMPADITLDAFADHHFSGTVDAIRPEINRETSTGVVRLRFLDATPEILPQMGARIAFLKNPVDPAIRSQGPRLVVPASAVAARGAQSVVFVYADGSVSQVPVVVGQRQGADAEITSGLHAGMKVVRSPPSGLASGDAVDLSP